MKVKFIAISALGIHRQIGLNGNLPWSLPDEYEHFKKTTKGHWVLIGRKNYESHKEDIEGVKPIVLTGSGKVFENALTAANMNEVLKLADENKIDQIFVIGGAEIYNLTLPYLSEFYCSIVDYDGPADKYFPEYMSYEWEMLEQEVHEKWTMYHMRKRPDF